MAQNQIIKNKRDAVITLSDNGGTNTFTVVVEPGDFTCEVPGPEVIDFMDRGRFSSGNIRYGADQPMTGSFSITVTDISDAGVAILSDFCFAEKPTAWVSTLGSTADVFTVTIKIAIEGTDFGDSADHYMSFPYSIVRGSYQEGDPGVITFSFTSYKLFPTVA